METTRPQSANIHALNWIEVANSLHEKGYAHLHNVLDVETCQKLITSYPDTNQYRKTVVMERHRFGFGEYKYFTYPLPELIAELRAELYQHLAPVANAWMRRLSISTQYPDEHQDFIKECHKAGQSQPTPLILKYGVGGYNTLHQDLYGAIYFPLQVAIFLSDYGTDYEGGEFVLTEQVPRSQSRARVFKPRQGDAILFATNFRPVSGKRGYYRAQLRHGVSEVTSGSRHTLGIILHDATY